MTGGSASPRDASLPGAGRTGRLGRLSAALCSGGGILMVAYAFPLAILAVGVPVALLVRLVMAIGGVLWTGRL